MANELLINPIQELDTLAINLQARVNDHKNALDADQKNVLSANNLVEAITSYYKRLHSAITKLNQAIKEIEANKENSVSNISDEEMKAFQNKLATLKQTFGNLATQINELYTKHPPTGKAEQAQLAQLLNELHIISGKNSETHNKYFSERKTDQSFLSKARQTALDVGNRARKMTTRTPISSQLGKISAALHPLDEKKIEEYLYTENKQLRPQFIAYLQSSATSQITTHLSNNQIAEIMNNNLVRDAITKYVLEEAKVRNIADVSRQVSDSTLIRQWNEAKTDNSPINFIEAIENKHVASVVVQWNDKLQECTTLLQEIEKMREDNQAIPHDNIVKAAEAITQLNHIITKIESDHFFTDKTSYGEGYLNIQSLYEVHFEDHFGVVDFSPLIKDLKAKAQEFKNQLDAIPADEEKLTTKQKRSTTFSPMLSKAKYVRDQSPSVRHTPNEGELNEEKQNTRQERSRAYTNANVPLAKQDNLLNPSVNHKPGESSHKEEKRTIRQERSEAYTEMPLPPKQVRSENPSVPHRPGESNYSEEIPQLRDKFIELNKQYETSQNIRDNTKTKALDDEFKNLDNEFNGLIDKIETANKTLNTENASLSSSLISLMGLRQKANDNNIMQQKILPAPKDAPVIKESAVTLPPPSQVISPDPSPKLELPAEAQTLVNKMDELTKSSQMLNQKFSAHLQGIAKMSDDDRAFNTVEAEQLLKDYSKLNYEALAYLSNTNDTAPAIENSRRLMVKTNQTLNNLNKQLYQPEQAATTAPVETTAATQQAQASTAPPRPSTPIPVSSEVSRSAETPAKAQTPAESPAIFTRAWLKQAWDISTKWTIDKWTTLKSYITPQEVKATKGEPSTPTYLIAKLVKPSAPSPSSKDNTTTASPTSRVTSGQHPTSLIQDRTVLTRGIPVVNPVTKVTSTTERASTEITEKEAAVHRKELPPLPPHVLAAKEAAEAAKKKEQTGSNANPETKTSDKPVEPPRGPSR